MDIVISYLAVAVIVYAGVYIVGQKQGWSWTDKMAFWKGWFE